MRSGKLISFEGPDGAGKTTQIKLLADGLATLGIVFNTTKEPGGTPFGAHLRSLLLDPNSNVNKKAQLMLMMADRAQHVPEIKHWLETGIWAILDRYSDSSTAYQGYGNQQDLCFIGIMNSFTMDGLAPDLTIMLMIKPENALSRIGQDKFESMPDEFRRRVYLGYERIAEANKKRIVRIDVDNMDIEAVQKEVFEAVYWRLLNSK